MPPSPQGPPPAPRVALRIEHDVPCPDCGYNLRGLRLDGRCPECGRPTIDTFAKPLRAQTGVLAEHMLRRPATILLVILAWWIAVGLASPYLAAQAAYLGYLLLSALAALWLIAGSLHAWRVCRKVRTRSGGSSKPLQDIAGHWMLLCWMAVAGALVLIALIGLAVSLPLLGRLILLAGAAGAATAAWLLAARAAAVILRRSAQIEPTTSILSAAIAQVVLIAACTAPTAGAGLPLIMVGRVIVGSAALVTFLIATFIIIGRLQEAQGSVVSLGRRSRR